MQRLLSSSPALFSLPRLKAVCFLFCLSRQHSYVVHSPRRHLRSDCSAGAQKLTREVFKTTKRNKDSGTVLRGEDHPHLIWWQERMQMCKKPSSCQLIKRLSYTNLLGLDPSLKNGSLKEGTLNSELLQFKSKFPREVLLCRVGDFYEAVGFDACVLVEHAGLNPCGGLRTDSVPKAGCPVVNLRQTLDDLTRSGFSVCIVEEVQGPTQARSRKGRFVSGHAHPGNPYVFGLAGGDLDVDFPDPMPVIGISRSAKGYCLITALETMKTFSAEEGLTEEAVVTKLRTVRYHYLFLHDSLRHNPSGTTRWGEFGEGGLLWGECNGKQFEWFGGSPVPELLCKVRELYALDPEESFRNVTPTLENRPRPLYFGAATQVGVLPTEGIPSLLNVLFPSGCVGLAVAYIRGLLLNPPTYDIASAIQAICKHMCSVTCSIPDFTCTSAAKLVKLLEAKEANHIEFCRIKDVVDDIVQLYGNPELYPVLEKLTEPTCSVTGLTIDLEMLVHECRSISQRIADIIFLDGDRDQSISSFPCIPDEFFIDMESLWKGRVKRIHAEDAFVEVERAAEALSLAVTEDFYPIVLRVKAIMSPLGGPRGEISYSKENEAIWFKGKRFAPTVWGDTPGEEQIRQLVPASDSKGKKVGEDWFTTKKVEKALRRYDEANDRAKLAVMDVLRGLSGELQSKINILVYASTLLVIAKALFCHVSEGRRKKWVFPTLREFRSPKEKELQNDPVKMELIGLSPFWFNIAQALLGVCGLMVPAESAVIPHFDSIMLHMKSYDSPADGKSSFQMEMSELRSILNAATSRSLVLVDEICRGTEMAKGTCIAASIVESLDGVGCLGIVSTHLHGLFDLPLRTRYTIHKAMGTEVMDGQLKPTWKLTDGICTESLAFETARNEGVPDYVVSRAEEIYLRNWKEKIKVEGMLRSSSIIKSDQRHVSVSANSVSIPSEYLSSNSAVTLSKEQSEATVGDKDDTVTSSLAMAYETDSSTTSTSELSGMVFDAIESFSSVTGRTITAKSERLIQHIVLMISMICQKKLIELYKQKCLSVLLEVDCQLIGAKEQPPPSTVGTSSVYAVIRPDQKIYIGQTDDLAGRVRAHRCKADMQGALIVYIVVPGKSLASQLETLLINQLPLKGFQLTNKADGKHRNFGTAGLGLETLSTC
ncbi:DNA mismatch repair protein MSH1, mitochondrial isoform X3 [Nymphaea colorata]|uniref:DNA mismatch repair protein MSH1, mitochondrial isoform X3 n=1 Tax=Nymphaea colorata TaxID=210225 RepID=UPI00214F4148|nr:DNA mismatch repair protein MSH1, mitochondrial isoform X3 [Nymphaea colorata]